MEHVLTNDVLRVPYVLYAQCAGSMLIHQYAHSESSSVDSVSVSMRSVKNNVTEVTLALSEDWREGARGQKTYLLLSPLEVSINCWHQSRGGKKGGG